MLALALASVISFGAVSGTFAMYSAEIKTGTNTISSADFVLSGINLDATGTKAYTFPRTGVKNNYYAVAPGSSGTVYFTITSKSTVGMNYAINLYRSSTIGNIQYKLYEKGFPGWDNISLSSVTDGAVVDGMTLTQSASQAYQYNGGWVTQEYKIDWVWPVTTPGNDDNAYINKEEKFMIDVVGTSALGDDFAYVSGSINNGSYSKTYDGMYKITRDTTGRYTIDLSNDYQVYVNPNASNPTVNLSTGHSQYSLVFTNKDLRPAAGSFEFSGKWNDTSYSHPTADLKIYFSKLGNLSDPS